MERRNRVLIQGTYLALAWDSGRKTTKISTRSVGPRAGVRTRRPLEHKTRVHNNLPPTFVVPYMLCSRKLVERFKSCVSQSQRKNSSCHICDRVSAAQESSAVTETGPSVLPAALAAVACATRTKAL